MGSWSWSLPRGGGGHFAATCSRVTGKLRTRFAALAGGNGGGVSPAEMGPPLDGWFSGSLFSAFLHHNAVPASVEELLESRERWDACIDALARRAVFLLAWNAVFTSAMLYVLIFSGGVLP